MGLIPFYCFFGTTSTKATPSQVSFPAPFGGFALNGITPPTLGSDETAVADTHLPQSPARV